MEERIIDDEYGRGVRLRKTKDGYVDVTDEQLEEEEVLEEGEGEEIEFEFPVFEDDKDAEELAVMTPEEAQEFIRQREEEEKRRLEAYENTCAEGEEQLTSGNMREAEVTFERALQLDDIATRATVGYWRAKTADFAQPDVLLEDYLDDGMKSLEHDLGTEALQILSQQYAPVFEKRVAELEEEIAPLRATVEEKRDHRRTILKERLKKSCAVALIFAVPVIALLVLSIVFGVKNFTTRGNEYVVWTIVFIALFIVTLVIEAFLGNKAINDVHMYRLNEKMRSTEEGKKLQTMLAYQTLYQQLLDKSSAQTDKE